jgi:hypothetical protein
MRQEAIRTADFEEDERDCIAEDACKLLLAALSRKATGHPKEAALRFLHRITKIVSRVSRHTIMKPHPPAQPVAIQSDPRRPTPPRAARP